MTVREAAERLNLSAKAVYDLVAAREIPCRRLGLKRGKIILDLADVEAYWTASKAASSPTEVRASSRHLRPPSPSRRPS